jgi:hypothetical protein
MSNVRENQYDDEEIPLCQLKEKIQLNKQNDDDIPLNILAEFIRNSNKKVTQAGARILNGQEKGPQLKEDSHSNAQQSLITLHEVDHLDYFKTVRER